MLKDQIPDWILQDCGIIVEYLIPLSIELLKKRKELFGNGCLLDNDNIVTPLLFTNDPIYSMSDATFHARIIESTKEQVTTAKVKAAALVMDGKIDINRKQYNAIVIILFHRGINLEISYINPYTLRKSIFSQNIEVSLIEEMSFIDLGSE